MTARAKSRLAALTAVLLVVGGAARGAWAAPDERAATPILQAVTPNAQPATPSAQGAAPDSALSARARYSGPDSALEARTRDVASQLRCPVCQGLSLQDSPSELAQEMRGVVKEQLRAGRTPGEVKQYFINRYGEWILMEPQRHGFNWVVYALPALVLVGGLTVIFAALRRWTAGAAPEPDGPVAHSTAASRDVTIPGGSE